MEHEFEKTIREKVAQAELAPATWDREWVRSRIGFPSKRKKYALYYAAASILLASALFFFGIEQTRIKQLEVQLRSIELSIEENKGYQSQLEKESLVLAQAVACREPENVASSESPQVVRVSKKVSPTETKDDHLTSDPELVEETAMTEVKTIEKETPATEILISTTKVQTKSVQAIIGGDDQKLTADNNKERKFKFRLFPQGEEPVPVGGGESINLLSKNQKQ